MSRGPVMTLIQDAYDIIKDINRWAQGGYAFNAEGTSCFTSYGSTFCALGALNYVSFMNKDAPYYERRITHRFRAQAALQRVSEELFGGKPIQWVNDAGISLDIFAPRPTPDPEAHKNVLKVYETALERWKDREPTIEEMTKPGHEWPEGL